MITKNEGKPLQSKSRPPDIEKSRLDLLEKIWNGTKSNLNEHPLLVSLLRTTHNALDTAASALLLLEEEKPRLLLKHASGSVESQRLYMDKKSGLAGWVVQSGKPIVINDTSKNEQFDRDADNPAGFKTKSMMCVPLLADNHVIGIIEALNKTDDVEFSDRDLRTMLGLANTATLILENIRQNNNLQDSYKSTVKALVSLADAKETHAIGHSKRVAEYALIGANEMGLSWMKKQTIEYAAILHDIGKLGIPDHILNKPNGLTKEEWEIVRKHTVTGYELLKEIPFLKDASELILYHHERYDGKGYPCGLAGEAIPIGARLIAIADAFDNMTTEHTYKKAVPKKLALTELQRCIRTQFCPEATKAFISRYVKLYMSGQNNKTTGTKTPPPHPSKK